MNGGGLGNEAGGGGGRGNEAGGGGGRGNEAGGGRVGACEAGGKGRSGYGSVPRDELPLWLWLGAMAGAGPRRAKLLLDAFGSPAAVLEQSLQNLASLDFMTPHAAALVLDAAERRGARQLTESILGSGIDIVTIGSGSYPPLLRYICDPPLVLFRRGSGDALAGSPGAPEYRGGGGGGSEGGGGGEGDGGGGGGSEDGGGKENRGGGGSGNGGGISDAMPVTAARAVAIVGTRHPTAYGVSMTRRLAAELCGYGFTVVSGLAMGIDAAAHAEALAVGGKTAAFLGCGVDRAYPQCNRRLMGEIVEKGAVYSEYLPGTLPMPQNFPQRNRLISGSSLGVVVVEAGERSGALITAGLAAEQGRDVYAVPGNATSAMSRGSNALLRDGACIATCAEDIVFTLGPYLGAGLEPPPGTRPAAERRRQLRSQAASLEGPEREVASFLQARGAASMDEIAENTGMDIAAICAAVVMLETEGLVRKLPYETYEFVD